jgi:hypothetical protein
MFILTLQLIKLKHSQMWLSKELHENCVKIPAFEALEKANTYMKSFSKSSLDYSAGPRPSFREMYLYLISLLG